MVFLSFLNNSSGFSSRCNCGSSNRDNTGNWKSTSESTNDWSVVDDMVGGVGRGVLLDSDLGNMMDLVVDLVSNMLDNWGSGNMVSSWGSNMVGSWGSNMVGSWDNSRGSLDLNSLNLSNSWGSNNKRGSNSMVVGNWSSNSKTMGSIGSSWDNSSMGNGGNWCNSWSRGIDTSYQAMAVSKVLSISISSRSCKATGSKREDNL